MKKNFLAAILLLSIFNFQFSIAQTQQGFVRTVARPDQPSQRLQGVVVRVQGDYNPVMTDEQGAFQVLMPGVKNGAAFTLAGVNKGGYELQESELIGRQIAFSTSVPLEIIMVSRRQLQKDKQRIEQAARDNIERHYEQQLNDLNEQLAKAQLSNQEYEDRLALLEQDYNRFEPLIEQMAERYARTDYSNLSPADSLIQQAIEAGDLQLAQERILAKGDPVKREKKMLRIRKLAEAERDELASDFYNLYAIYLSRFQNDSALSFIIRRAYLDTTNAQWQIDAGNAYDKIGHNYDQALVFYRRALRYALANEGPNALRTAVAHNNIAYALFQLHENEEAIQEQHKALRLYRLIYGENHEYTAARLINMGALHYYVHQFDSAQFYFTEAENVYSAIESADPDKQEIPTIHASLLANQAGIDFAQRNYDSACQRLKKALDILPPKGAEDAQVLYLTSLGAVYDEMKRKDEAQAIWKQAYDIALRIYGPEHQLTKELASYIE